MNKLIKINFEYYIIDDSDIQIEDWYMTTNSIEQCLSSYEQSDLTDNCKKITHSTEILEGVIKLNKSEILKFIGEIDVKKLAEDTFKENEIHEEIYNTNELQDAYKAGIWDGVIKCLELTKDKLYTEEDMRNAICKSFLLGVERDTIYSEEVENDIIKSLQPKQEWNVRIINNKIELL